MVSSAFAAPADTMVAAARHTSFEILVPGKAGPALSKGNICVCNARGVVVNDDQPDSKENKKYLKDLKEYQFWITDAEGTPENKDVKARPKAWTTPKGTPFVWRVGGGEVVTGVDVGCQGMLEGEKRKLRVPSTEAYGTTGFPAWKIPPKAKLTVIRLRPTVLSKHDNQSMSSPHSSRSSGPYALVGTAPTRQTLYM